MWGEGQLMDPGQDNVLSGLRHKHSEDCQNTRHPQLYCSYRCLRGGKAILAQCLKSVIIIQCSERCIVLFIFCSSEQSMHMQVLK